MSKVKDTAQNMLCVKAYLLESFRNYCIDNSISVNIQVLVLPEDTEIQVPLEYVHDNLITINLSACQDIDFDLKKNLLTFKAAFNTVMHDIVIPTDKILVMYDLTNLEFQLALPYYFSEEKKSPTLQIVASNKEAVAEKTNSIKPTLRIVK